VVTTANNVRSIPDELYRPGRIDASFWLDLPGSKERRDIIKIQIRKSVKDGKQRDPDKVLKPADLEQLVKASKGLSGAGIEVWVKSAVKRAWTDKSGNRDINVQDFLDTIGDVSKTNMNSENIRKAMEWARDNKVKSASGNPIGKPVEEGEENATVTNGTTIGDRKVGLKLASSKVEVKEVPKEGTDAPQA
jgi:hypothetical protein